MVSRRGSERRSYGWTEVDQSTSRAPISRHGVLRSLTRRRALPDKCHAPRCAMGDPNEPLRARRRGPLRIDVPVGNPND
jgi:hypothetical protein